MRWHELSMERLEIPFRVSFEHTAARRTQGESVLVKAVGGDGAQGWGEGCPRRYVTGETMQSAMAFFAAHRRAWMNLGTLDDLRRWINTHRPLIDRNPAAFCAVELALLNALALQSAQSVESLLSLPALSGEFRYTAVLGSRDTDTFARLLARYRRMGVTDFKVKLFGDATVDRSNLSLMRRDAPAEYRLRYDANNRWHAPDDAIAFVRALGVDITAIEEPLAVNDYPGCLAVAAGLGCPVILDESCRTLHDLDMLPGTAKSWVVNIRVSKMGGLLRSLEIAAAARARGIPLIIGAHVGESALLTRAALTVANAYRDVLLAQEGAFGTWLLQHDLVDPGLQFGPGGVLAAVDVPLRIAGRHRTARPRGRP